MADQNAVKVDRQGRLARVTLDRPPLNVLDIPSIRALNEALVELSRSDGPDVIVLSGEGPKGFSAGVDVKDHTPDKIAPMLDAFHGCFRLLASSDRVTIAAVHGLCLGGGFELAIACDILICEEGTRLQVPEINLGCFPPVAVAALPERVGPQRAAEWILTGRQIPLEEAVAAGLVNRVVPRDGLPTAVMELTEALLGKSSAVLRITTRALKNGRSARYLEALGRAERAYHEELAATADMHEGIASYMEKRQPVWTHR
jgi:cyclohexa-1,5-dienecarbonyl-CoA hydratase